MSSETEQKIIRVSPSSLNAFLRCERSFKYQRIDELAPIKRHQPEVTESKGGNLEKGDFFHVLLRIYYKCIVLELKKREAAELAKIFGREYAPQSNLPISISEYLLEIFDQYVSYYISDVWRPVEVEESFSFCLYEDPELYILMEGIIDLVVDIPGVGETSVDHKTASSFGLTKTMGNQFKTYVLYKQHKRMVVNKIHIQKSVGDKVRFTRHIMNYMPQQLADWAEDAIFHIKTLAQYLEHDWFPKRETSCYDFRPCAYIPPCSATPRTMEMVARRDFEVKHNPKWDPKTYEERQREELAWIKQHA